MSIKTNNFGFNKPELTDAADITQQNTNWDMLDSELFGLKKQTTSLNEEIDTKAPMYTYGTTDLTAGVSKLTSGNIHIVYE